MPSDGTFGIVGSHQDQLTGVGKGCLILAQIAEIPALPGKLRGKRICRGTGQDRKRLGVENDLTVQTGGLGSIGFGAVGEEQGIAVSTKDGTFQCMRHERYIRGRAQLIGHDCGIGCLCVGGERFRSGHDGLGMEGAQKQDKSPEEKQRQKGEDSQRDPNPNLLSPEDQKPRQSGSNRGQDKEYKGKGGGIQRISEKQVLDALVSKKQGRHGTDDQPDELP